jgi:hypothetical protein
MHLDAAVATMWQDLSQAYAVRAALAVHAVPRAYEEYAVHGRARTDTAWLTSEIR